MLSTPSVEIIRLEEDDFDGTFGVLLINKSRFCDTLERPNLLNAPDLSCVPAQQYFADRIFSPSLKCETFRFINVPGRSLVQFEIGNFMKQSKGCIFLGAFNRSHHNLSNSGITFSAFMSVLNGIDRIKVTIREVF